MWDKNKIIEKLYNFEEDLRFAQAFYRVFSPKNIKKRDLKVPPDNPAMGNAFFDEAFGTLTKTEQYLLLNLYGKGSEMNLDKTYSEEALSRVMKETGMTKRGVDMRLFGAFRVLLRYLNGEGQ